MKSVHPQPESGNVAKDAMWKIQILVFRNCIRRVSGMRISDRKCVPLMICQLFTAVYSGIRGCELILVAKTIQSRQEVWCPTRVSSGAKAHVCVENLLEEYTVTLSEQAVERVVAQNQSN
eukprot:1147760-Pelagomonas_calceolata.AAC.1